MRCGPPGRTSTTSSGARRWTPARRSRHCWRSSSADSSSSSPGCASGRGRPEMAKHLVVVESPAKAKTLGRYLGRDYQVKASVGHVVDLPKSKLGVDIEDDFKAEYTVIHGKTSVLNEIKHAAKDKDVIYLAPDPDREGEAIAWHIAQRLGHPKRKNVRRVLFNEITKKSVQDALQHPRDLDQHLFEAQQARRVLDRLVGYRLSPLLWQKVRRGLSAGRVQS